MADLLLKTGAIRVQKSFYSLLGVSRDFSLLLLSLRLGFPILAHVVLIAHLSLKLLVKVGKK